ncbi:MAG TPA: iron uptake porin, partial [Elainellaceae cyanobacterium]
MASRFVWYSLVSMPLFSSLAIAPTLPSAAQTADTIHADESTINIDDVPKRADLSSDDLVASSYDDVDSPVHLPDEPLSNRWSDGVSPFNGSISAPEYRVESASSDEAEDASDASRLDVERPAMAQITSVSRLSDVQSTDWAYQALRSLVERYGVIVGYPDGTFRGNRSLSRYEFAVAVLAALDRITELIDQGLADRVERDDLDTLLRLQTEFAADLALLGGRMRSLESRTALIEANRFSITTKLSGEAIFAFSGRSGVDEDNRTVFRDRVRLDLVTSFTGYDQLNTRLVAGSARPFNAASAFDAVDAGTSEGSLVPRIRGNTDNDLELDWLAYRFPVGDRLDAYVSATGGIHSDYVPSTFSPLFDDFDGGNGSISAFSQESPIYRIGGGAGAAISIFLADDSLALTASYLADDAADPTPGQGLFNGDYAALGQITFLPGDRLQIGATYIHGYHTEDNAIFDLGQGDEFFVGTVPANAAHIELGTSAVTNSYGVQASYQVNSRFTVHAFGGYTDVIFVDQGNGEVWYYGVGFGFPDLLLPGSLGGLMRGVEPYLGGVEGVDLTVENDTSVHLEAFYKLRLSDFISITPG